jgi:hypothetical protein
LSEKLLTRTMGSARKRQVVPGMIHIARKRQVYPGTIFFGQEAAGIAKNDIFLARKREVLPGTIYFFARKRQPLQ